MVLNEQKEEMLANWESVRNAILRAIEGDMRVHYIKPKAMGETGVSAKNRNKVEGVFVEVLLRFPEPVADEFTEEEKTEFLRGLSEE